MVVRFAMILGFVILSRGAFAARARIAQYIIHYQTQAEVENLKARVEASDYEVVQDSPDLLVIFVRGPVGIERVRALATDLVVERSSKVSTARKRRCTRGMTED